MNIYIYILPTCTLPIALRPIHACLSVENMPMLRAILETSANIDCRQAHGMTPLLAAAYCCVPAIEPLLAARARADVMDTLGHSPLAMPGAARRGAGGLSRKGRGGGERVNGGDVNLGRREEE